MKKVLAMVAFVMLSVIVYAFNDKPDTNQGNVSERRLRL